MRIIIRQVNVQVPHTVDVHDLMGGDGSEFRGSASQTRLNLNPVYVNFTVTLLILTQGFNHLE